MAKECYKNSNHEYIRGVAIKQPTDVRAFLFKKLHNRNVVTLKVLPSPNPTPLHPNLPLLEEMLQVVF